MRQRGERGFLQSSPLFRRRGRGFSSPPPAVSAVGGGGNPDSSLRRVDTGRSRVRGADARMVVAAACPNNVPGFQPYLGGAVGGAEEPVEVRLLGVAGEVAAAVMLWSFCPRASAPLRRCKLHHRREVVEDLLVQERAGCVVPAFIREEPSRNMACCCSWLLKLLLSRRRIRLCSLFLWSLGAGDGGITCDAREDVPADDLKPDSSSRPSGRALMQDSKPFCRRRMQVHGRWAFVCHLLLQGSTGSQAWRSRRRSGRRCSVQASTQEDFFVIFFWLGLFCICVGTVALDGSRVVCTCCTVLDFDLLHVRFLKKKKKTV